MVRAILAGVKTQTRRIVKPQPSITTPNDASWRDSKCDLWRNSAQFARDCCPFGSAGDRLWVRETFYCDDFRYPNGDIEEMRAALDFRATHDCSDWEAGCPCSDDEGHSAWRPSIHMPRWASRTTLEITGVRLERLQAITEADAKAEGIQSELLHPPHGYDPDNFNPPGAFGYVSGIVPFPKGTLHVNAVNAFAELWDSINEKSDWKSDPWVWVVEFRRV